VRYRIKHRNPTINDKEKQSLRRRGYLIIFLQLLAGGGMFAAMILLISLFYDGKAAQFLRLFSMFIFLGIILEAGSLVVGLSLLAVIIKNIWKTQ
jgi:ABC-type multidrug transport system fused ATPase/permease subunit